MIGKLREAANAARLRAGQMWREHKEREEAKKATAALNSEHGHGRFFLLHVPAMATILAAVTEWYWAVLFCIEATGSIDWNYETAIGAGVASSSLWNFAFSTHWPVFVGLVCATVPIVMLSMVWLPVQFSMRGSGRWRRGSVIAVGVLANILVIVSGTVVMNYNRQDQVREAVVMEQTAAQGRAAIDARLAFEQEQLRLALTNENAYLNQAASVGAAEWERSYVAQARATNDPRLPQLERALGAARAADERRANIERLTIERATAAPEAASQANVADTVGAELNTFAQYVEVWRPPFIAVICTLIGIFGAWWVLALMQGLNPRDVMRSGWADEGHRIEDLREQEPVVAQAPAPPRQRRKVYNPETGREEVFVQPKGYWRGTGKKQRNADGTEGELMEFAPEVPPSETGVEHDGGGRVGSVGAPVAEPERPEEHPEPYEPEASDADGIASSERISAVVVQNDSPSEALSEPELTEAERAEFAMLAATADEPVNEPVEPASVIDAEPEQVREGGDDGEVQSDAAPDYEPVDHGEPRNEPEQDERRLIAATVAAE
jgi:hypothetical protein